MGLNLNYTPNRLVDITTLTEDQWLSWRRKGIGGSDVAVALNSSPYRTARDLYYDKIGVVMSDDGPDKSITFQIGHLLEDVVAQIFAKKTGLSSIFMRSTVMSISIRLTKNSAKYSGQMEVNRCANASGSLAP